MRILANNSTFTGLIMISLMVGLLLLINSLEKNLQCKKDNKFSVPWLITFINAQ
jgi:hypothetical protein